MSACTDDDIDSVKSGYLNFDKSVTVGNLLDNRRLCDKVEWDIVIDKSKRKTVTYKCVVDIENYSKGKYEIALLDLNDRKDDEFEKLNKNLEVSKNKLNELERSASIYRMGIEVQRKDYENALKIFNDGGKPIGSDLFDLELKRESLKGLISINLIAIENSKNAHSISKYIKYNSLCLSSSFSNNETCNKVREDFRFFFTFKSEIHQKILKMSNDAFDLERKYKNVYGQEHVKLRNKFTDLNGSIVKIVDEYVELISNEYFKEASSRLDVNEAELHRIEKKISKLDDKLSLVNSSIVNLKSNIKVYNDEISTLDNRYLSMFHYAKDKYRFVRYTEVIGFTLQLDGGFVVSNFNAKYTLEDNTEKVINSNHLGLGSIYKNNDDIYKGFVLSLMDNL